MNGYDLSRNWFDWCFENPEKISPNHTALYFFIIEHCNRLAWKEKFGLPTEMAKDAIGIKSYNTYINTLRDLVEFGFIIMIEKSKNQYSSNIVALSNFDKAIDKALDKAIVKHLTKQRESISSIDKPITIEHINKEHNIYCSDIIECLNLEVGSSYKKTTKKTNDFIIARIREGFTVDEIKSVIRYKKLKWINDVNMSKYLRPETLFGTKFESYLNEMKIDKDYKNINTIEFERKEYSKW